MLQFRWGNHHTKNCNGENEKKETMNEKEKMWPCEEKVVGKVHKSKGRTLFVVYV